jgi:lipid-A-disaccharide synthase
MPLPSALIVAGEASGDQHAADVVRQLRQLRPELRLFGMGGPKLEAQGVERLFSASEISVMGLVEVLPKLRRIVTVLNALERAAARRRPDLAILVDVPDFNLRLAKRLKRLGIPVAYFISPMVWAWRRGRLRTIEEVVDEMLCILPFEEPFYRRAGVRAKYVGSPVLEQVPPVAPPEAFRAALGLAQEPTLALLPGSRGSELARILPEGVKAAAMLHREWPSMQVVVPVAPGIDPARIRTAFEGSGVSPILVEGRAPEVVGASDVAIVASGTATLEAGLMERPLVVVYRMAASSALIARAALKIPHVSLVNLLAGREVVPELLQGEMTAENIAREARRLWPPGPERSRVLEGLAEVRRALGPPGAARRTAEALAQLLP